MDVGVVMVTWPHVISSEIIKLVVTMKWNTYRMCGDVFSLFVNESRQLTVVFCLLLISVVFYLSIHRKKCYNRNTLHRQMNLSVRCNKV